MTYARTYTIDASPLADTTKAAIATKLDGDMTNIFTNLNTHEALTATHGATGAIVGTTNSQVMTNKTLTAPTINAATVSGTLTTVAGITVAGQYAASTKTLTSGATVAINWADGNVQVLTLDHTGITVTFSNPINGGRYMLVIIQGAGGSKTITTWPTMKWKDGTAPTLSTTAARADIIGITYVGTTYYGLPGIGVY